jgi:hypothetical protein
MSAHPIAAVAARRVSNLLNFESNDDLSFITAEPASSVRADTTVMREGSRSLLIPPSTRSITVKLTTLLEGRAFPADWTLIGGYFYADAPAYITATIVTAGGSITRTVGIGPRAWTPVMVDVSTLPASSAAASIRFDFVPAPGGAVYCDDVVLVDNQHLFIDTRASGAEGWAIARRGLAYVVDRPNHFTFAIYTAEAQLGGWSIVECNEARVRFASRGKPSTYTVYADGRSYCDGYYKPLDPSLAYANEIAPAHQSPAALSVPETLGRVNRNSHGDADNDGYNESLGAYELIASGPRFEVTLSPQSVPVPRPVLEIANVPAGQLLVTMEGQLIPSTRRLENGNVLIDLPTRLARPAAVNVRVQ